MNQTFATRPLPAAADLYGDLEPAPKASWRDTVPGLLVTVLAALASGYLSDHYGAPLTLMALLIGLALNFLGTEPKLQPGLTFSSRTLLRVGIVLVGARVTLGQVVDLGPIALIALLVIVAATVSGAVFAARRFGYDVSFGALAGGAVAICGASAAMALATTLGERRISQAQLALVLVGISAMSATAMVVYPALCHHLAFTDRQAGFVLGAAIHDVAQSIGAGYAFSPLAGQNATIVKLTRVALLAPLLALVGYWLAEKNTAKRSLGMPWFVVGFFAVAAVNSTGIIPSFVGTGATALATGLLTCAVTSTAVRSPMASLLKSGPRPLLIILVASLISLGLSCLVAAFLIH